MCDTRAADRSPRVACGAVIHRLFGRRTSHSGGTQLSFEPAATFVDPLVELIRYTSSGLGKDVIAAIERAREHEEAGSRAHTTFGLMLENVKRARELSAPICQDTG